MFADLYSESTDRALRSRAQTGVPGPKPAPGVLAGVAGNANHFMWFMVPYDFAVYSIATTVVAWAVASLPLAAIVRPGAGAAACATPDAP